MKQDNAVLAALDLGSSKVSFLIAKVNRSSELLPDPLKNIEIVGIGVAPSFGVKQGVVIDIEATTEAIRKARREAELMAGLRVFETLVSLSGAHICSFDSKGMIAIKSKEVTAHDMERVIEAAKAVTVPSDRQVLHVIPREYRVDHQAGILNPIGMTGVRLEVVAHIVTGSQATIQNNLKTIERAGLKIKGIVMSQLATAKAVLSEDEKSLGVCVADVGAGSTHLIYYVNSSVAHMSQIGIGGNHFTQDIAIGLRTPQSSAENIKISKGYCMTVGISDEDTVEVEGVGGRKSRLIKKKDLAEIIEPRAEELIAFIGHDVEKSNLSPFLGSGIVLTGGGAHLGGLVEMAEYQLDYPVRLGLPKNLGGLMDSLKSGRFATVVGLLIHGWEEKLFVQVQNETGDSITPSVQMMADRLKNFFRELF
ncbi:MAG: cell division protein FtsA [Bdellovibrionaceae bacterium]|nr:cell division protein FtsA [Pseudobdellovibrionaceae bacterium]MDW8190488.1 cell division protein FtsA [Pseudobdellovibrionaceae bacterium]